MAVVSQSNGIRHYCSIWKSDRENTWCLVIKAAYIILHQLDLILTALAVSLGLSELNPLMKDILASPPQLVVIKLVIPLFIAWLVPGKLLIPAVAILGTVLGWNVKELLLVLF